MALGLAFVRTFGTLLRFSSFEAHHLYIYNSQKVHALQTPLAVSAMGSELGSFKNCSRFLTKDICASGTKTHTISFERHPRHRQS